MPIVMLILLLGILGLVLLAVVPASRLARGVRLAGPVALLAVGGLLTVIGRGALGVPLVAVAMTWLGRAMRAGPMSGAGADPARSSARTAVLDMELDHGTGTMTGRVVSGAFAGRDLDGMSREELRALALSLAADGDSLSLLEAYLDRRFAGWREDAQADADGGLGGSSRTGAMSKEEAYEVLGLAPGASTDEIREAHRRLMKALHPDRGGSDWLAARINEARRVLLG